MDFHQSFILLKKFQNSYRMRRSLICILFCLSFSINNYAQGPVDTLSWDGFFNIIKHYHPITQQANLLQDLARAKKLKAIGGFDPKIETDFDQKYYGGTDYYTFLTPQLKLPLWYGIELKGSYSTAEGAFLNPESKLPKEGLGYAGINFELGKGLFIDERRAAIKQASIFARSSENDRNQILNDFFYDAGVQYIDWHNKYQYYKIYEEALVLAKIRFDGIKQSFINGDKAAVDTLEAQLIVQQRQTMLQQASIELIESKYLLANFMWLENKQPIDADKLNVRPVDLFNVPMNLNLSGLGNPKLLSYGFKLEDLQVERRLKAENLKPQLGLQLGVLNQGKTILRNVNTDYWANNNKVNIRFSMPLTFSKARGELSEVKIKIEQTQFEMDYLRNELFNKIKENNNEILTLKSQLSILEKTLELSIKLLEAEELKFKLGESSLFLLNSRESKLLDAREKKALTEAKLKKSLIKSFWINGNMIDI